MTTINYSNSKLVFMDASGNTGTIISPESISTPSITTSGFSVFNGTGSAGTILSTTGSSLSWISPLLTTDSSSNITKNSVNNVNTLTTTTLNATNITSSATFTNQVSFNLLPTSVTPTISSHLATKNYVDTLEPSGIFTMFLNYSQTSSVNSYKILSNTLSTAVISQVTTSVTAGLSAPIATFISGVINITQILPSLLTLYIYGKNITGNFVTYYFFNLKIYNSVTSTLSTIKGTAQSSAILSTTVNPSIHKMVLDIPTTITTNLTDMIVIELHAFNASTTNVSIYTFFENNNYSYAQFQSNTIINPLQNYTWITPATSNLDMNGFNISSTGNLTISRAASTTFSLGSQSSIINIGTDSTTATNINLLSSSNSASSIFINAPLTLNYTTLPSTGDIGEIISLGASDLIGSDSLTTSTFATRYYNLPYVGMWMFSATCGHNTTVSGNMTMYSIYLYNGVQGSGTYICSNVFNRSTAFTTLVGKGNMLNINGVIKCTDPATNVNFVWRSDFTSGTYKSDFDNITFVRIA